MIREESFIWFCRCSFTYYSYIRVIAFQRYCIWSQSPKTTHSNNSSANCLSVFDPFGILVLKELMTLWLPLPVSHIWIDSCRFSNCHKMRLICCDERIFQNHVVHDVESWASRDLPPMKLYSVVTILWNPEKKLRICIFCNS